MLGLALVPISAYLHIRLLPAALRSSRYGLTHEEDFPGVPQEMAVIVWVQTLPRVISIWHFRVIPAPSKPIPPLFMTMNPNKSAQTCFIGKKGQNFPSAFAAGVFFVVFLSTPSSLPVWIKNTPVTKWFVQ